jgi:hypothetical protein
MITCNRPGFDAASAVERLRFGGFSELIHVFCEPGTPGIAPIPDVVVHRNEIRLGAIGNWKCCLAWLVEHTAAAYLMVFEDDVEFCRGARDAWVSSLGELREVGYWSFYTPRRDRGLVSAKLGWVASNRGRDTWGTQAMCFPRSSAGRLLEYGPLHAEDQLRGPTDAIVAQCFLEARLPCYYHNPSLAEHLGQVSAVGHNWHDDHVGLEFNREFMPSTDVASSAVAPSDLARECSATRSCRARRAAVVTVYQDNIPREVVSRHAEVVCRFLPPGCEFVPRRASHHALGLDEYFHGELHHDAYLVLDIDCVPTASWVIPWMLENALAGVLIGAAQRANHLDNGAHLYAGPCAVAFSRETYKRIGRVSFRDTARGDVAEELTYACESFGIPVSLLWPTSVAVLRWTLLPSVPFGLGTTYGGAFYHAFEISKGLTVGMFLEKCQEVLNTSRGRSDWIRSSQVGPNAREINVERPVFHEQWYSESELARLEAAVRFIRPLKGDIVEVGCWEGRSTAVIANACFPEPVAAVDTWSGNVAEGPEHETVRIARQRDVFATFLENMRVLTGGNVSPMRMDVMDYLRRDARAIKFCHLDGSHDYRSVRDALEALLPRLVPGSVLIGHDYEYAHAGRDDLDGGVQRAVQEMIPEHLAFGNIWLYVHRQA